MGCLFFSSILLCFSYVIPIYVFFCSMVSKVHIAFPASVPLNQFRISGWWHADPTQPGAIMVYTHQWLNGSLLFTRFEFNDIPHNTQAVTTIVRRILRMDCQCLSLARAERKAEWSARGWSPMFTEHISNFCSSSFYHDHTWRVYFT